jgi:hypothetical protein
MRIKIFTLITCVLFCFLNAQEKTEEKLDCSKFKTGKFKLIHQKRNLYFIITRTATTQVEETFSLETGEKVLPDNHFLIKWENDCEYLLFLDTSEQTLTSELSKEANENGGVRNRILSVDGNCSKVNTYFKDNSFISEICKTE